VPDSLDAFVARAVRGQPDATCLIDPEDRRLSWVEFDRAAGRAAGALRSAGVRPGDVVASMCANELELIVAIFGAWRAGAVFAPVNPAHRGAVRRSLLELAAPRLVLVGDELDGDGVELLRELGTASLSLSELEGSPPSEVATARVDPEALALLLFTSGSTGVSKGCALTHEYLVWGGEQWVWQGELTPDDSVMTVGSFSHISPWCAFAGSVVNGTPHVLERRFSGSRFWSRAAATGATMFDYVGAMVAILLQAEGDPRPNRLRAALGGGAREAEIREFEERFGVKLLEAYGLTECTVPILQRESERRLGSMGRVSSGFEARVVGAEGRLAALGELQLRAPHPRMMFSGYWRNREATAAAFDGDWLRTRDVVRVDDDGYFYFVERTGELIRRRGENISAFDLEGCFLEHPAIHNCAAIGVPDELLGEEDVLLAVELHDGQVVEPRELLTWAEDRVASFMVPRYVRYMTLPMTASERVEKHKLRAAGITTDTFDREGERLNR
jgi:crotonobetaine/carnitine-CoA ligase